MEKAVGNGRRRYHQRSLHALFEGCGGHKIWLNRGQTRRRSRAQTALPSSNRSIPRLRLSLTTCLRAPRMPSHAVPVARLVSASVGVWKLRANDTLGPRVCAKPGWPQPKAHACNRSRRGGAAVPFDYLARVQKRCEHKRRKRDSMQARAARRRLPAVYGAAAASARPLAATVRGYARDEEGTRCHEGTGRYARPIECRTQGAAASRAIAPERDSHQTIVVLRGRDAG